MSVPMDISMSISDARRMLGKRFSNYSDDQVREMLVLLSLIAKQSLVDIGSKK